MTLNGNESYLGFWWSAMDDGNSVAFLSNGMLIGQIDNSVVINALGSNYFGNPNASFLGQDPSEPFTYVNIFGTGGTTLDQVIFYNSDRGTGFELDNLSIRESAVAPPYPGTIIPGGIAGAVPEPGSLALACIGGFGMLGYTRLRRRRQARA
jgi:hypothetical protein